MAYVQKFKFLATQCAVIGTPTRSPTTSPVVHIRRRKTLRMLLGKGATNNFHRRFLHNYTHNHNHRRGDDNKSIENKHLHNDNNNNASSKSVGVRSKLKDLFVSSPPPVPEKERFLTEKGKGCEGVGHGGLVVARVRPLSATLRQRLLMRRAWRPALVAIPEVSP